MKTTSALAIFTLSFFCMTTAHAAPVTFDWATIGNRGNAPDTEIMNDGTTGYGPVSYTYRISKTEVTNTQYTEFLNAVADTDTNEVYDRVMGFDTRGGITRSGSSGSYAYAVKPDSVGNGPGGTDYTYGDKPVVYVSFSAAMRFTNWLENGQPTGAQDASTTEAGVYTIGRGTNEVRNPNAKYFIPSEDEWYKAAYYDPNTGDGIYYNHAASTDSAPNNNLPSLDTGNSANFLDGDYTTGNISYPMTDVGAYALSESPYGTFDQGGNVWEWNEAVISLQYRGIRGASWRGNAPNILAASFQFYSSPTGGRDTIGFRVASIPEPSTLLLGALSAVGLLMRRRKSADGR